MRLSLRTCAALLLLAGAVACDGPENEPSPDAPIRIEAAAVHVLGTSPSIAVVQDIDVLQDGAVWILNSVDPLFIGFGADGALLAEHGSRGGGPEEFRAPAGLVAGGIDGEAWVLDGIRHSLIRISAPSEPWSEVALPADSLPRGSLVGGRDLTDSRVRTARLGDDVVFARTSGSLASGMFEFWRAIWSADLMAVDTHSGTARTVVDLGEVLGDPTPHLERSGDFPPLPLWFRLWDTCAGEIRVYDRLQAQVRSFAPDGRELGAVPVPPLDPGSVTHRQFARSVFGLLMAERLGRTEVQVSPEDSARLLNEVVAQADGDGEMLARFLPRYVDLRCVDDGTLWMRPFDLDVGGLRGGPTWLRVAADGSTREIRLPDRFDAHHFTADRIWGVQRDELDVASVAWIAVP